VCSGPAKKPGQAGLLSFITQPGPRKRSKTAKNAVKKIFQSPSPIVKIEFQGGEPTQNFEILKYIVEYAETLNLLYNKKVEFVICTNITLITLEMLAFLKKHNICISTSLDGNEILHNKNRPLQDNPDSYKIFIEKLKLCREYLGIDMVSALMTTTIYNIDFFQSIHPSHPCEASCHCRWPWPFLSAF